MSSRKEGRRPTPPPPPAPTRNRTWIVLGAVAVVVAIAVVVAVAASGGGSDSSSKGGNGSGGSSTAVEVAPVLVTGTSLPDFPSSGADKAIGMAVPSLSGQSLFDGSSMNIAPSGKPMAVVYLAHWCPHCQAEVPRLVALAKEGKLAGIEVYGIAAAGQDTLANYPPSTWLEDEAWPFPTMVDSERSTAAAAYGLTGYPYFLLVDAQGKVAARAEGEASDADIVAAVNALKAGKPVDLGSGASSSK
jgi:thiol-disulfide isomerase/thioredoxin